MENKLVPAMVDGMNKIEDKLTRKITSLKTNTPRYNKTLSKSLLKTVHEISLQDYHSAPLSPVDKVQIRNQFVK